MVGKRMRPGDGPIAVLTGDLVASRDLSIAELATVRARISEAGAVIDGWRHGLVLGLPQFFRGDSWQMALGDPGLFLRAAIGLRASVRAIDTRFDTRIGIGIGRADQIDREAVSLSVGDAFIRSGKALDDMKGAAGFRIVLPEDFASRLSLLPATVSLCAELVDRLQPAQAEAVWLSIAPSQPAQSQVAEQRGIKRQVVNRALSTSGFSALNEAANSVEALDWRERRAPKVKLI